MRYMDPTRQLSVPTKRVEVQGFDGYRCKVGCCNSKWGNWWAPITLCVLGRASSSALKVDPPHFWGQSDIRFDWSWHRGWLHWHLSAIIPLTLITPHKSFHSADPKTCGDRWRRGPWGVMSMMRISVVMRTIIDQKFCLEQVIRVDSLRTAAISDGFHRNASPLVAL